MKARDVGGDEATESSSGALPTPGFITAKRQELNSVPTKWLRAVVPTSLIKLLTE